MTFPGAGAHVYYNEAGEPLGWDYPDYDEPPYDTDGGHGQGDEYREYLWEDAEDQIFDETGATDDQAVADRFDELWAEYKARREGGA